MIKFKISDKDIKNLLCIKKNIFIFANIKVRKMALRVNEIVNELRTKVRSLLALYTNALSENKKLKEDIEFLGEKIKARDELIKELEYKLGNEKVADIITTGGGDEQARKRITKLVREVDKCIALLND